MNMGKIRYFIIKVQKSMFYFGNREQFSIFALPTNGNNSATNGKQALMRV